MYRVSSDPFKEDFKKKFTSAFLYGDTSEIDPIQNQLQCCGFDFPDKSKQIVSKVAFDLPKSCCATLEEDGKCTWRNAYETNCYKALDNFVMNYKIISIFILILVALFQFQLFIAHRINISSLYSD